MEQKVRHQFLIRRTTLSRNHVYQFQVTLATSVGNILLDTNGSRRLTSPSIFQRDLSSIENDLMAFDLDVERLCYDRSRLLSTWAAINTLASGAFLCFCLSRDIVKLGKKQYVSQSAFGQDSRFCIHNNPHWLNFRHYVPAHATIRD